MNSYPPFPTYLLPPIFGKTLEGRFQPIVNKESIMHFYAFFVTAITFPPTGFANPLPQDSVEAELEPYLLASIDPETTVPSPSNLFMPDNLQTFSFPSIQVNSILSSQYASTFDPSEPTPSTDLLAQCEIEQTSDASAAEKGSGICNVEPPRKGTGRNPGKGGEPEQPNHQQPIPPAADTLLQPQLENSCIPSSVFNEHLCCDYQSGPIGLVTQYLEQTCYYLIRYCIPCGS